jgi:hypothetical protein
MVTTALFTSAEGASVSRIDTLPVPWLELCDELHAPAMSETAATIAAVAASDEPNLDMGSPSGAQAIGA